MDKSKCFSKLYPTMDKYQDLIGALTRAKLYEPQLDGTTIVSDIEDIEYEDVTDQEDGKVK